jgi:hypothetical protein
LHSGPIGSLQAAADVELYPEIGTVEPNAGADVVR